MVKLLSPLLLSATIFALPTGCSSPPTSPGTLAPSRESTSTLAKYGGLE